MVEREAEKKQRCSIRNEKLKANRASVTEEQRRERLRIRHEKDRQKEQKNYKRKKKLSSVTEDNANQRQTTLKRLMRGDENELKRNVPVSVYRVPVSREANSSSLPWRRT